MLAALVTGLALAASPTVSAAPAYIDRAHIAGRTVVDSRPLSACTARTLAGALCIPAGDLVDAQGRLAAFRDLLWLFGTAGLDGRESVVVVGEDAAARDFVAGVLYLAGQAEVVVLKEPVSRLLESGAAAGAGTVRGLVRDKVFLGPLRDDRIVLASESADARSAMGGARGMIDGIAAWWRLQAGGRTDSRLLLDAGSGRAAPLAQTAERPRWLVFVGILMLGGIGLTVWGITLFKKQAA